AFSARTQGGVRSMNPSSVLEPVDSDIATDSDPALQTEQGQAISQPRAELSVAAESDLAEQSEHAPALEEQEIESHSAFEDESAHQGEEVQSVQKPELIEAAAQIQSPATAPTPTPPAQKPSATPGTDDCPKCGTKLINPENLGWCRKCGYCRSIE